MDRFKVRKRYRCVGLFEEYSPKRNIYVYTACDIVAFLMSRHGIQVTEEEVDDKIIGTFGECRKSDGSKGEGTASVEGADMDSRTEDVLGFVQIMALLFIPLLLKAKQSLDQEVEVTEEESNTMRRESATCQFAGHNHRHKGDSRNWGCNTATSNERINTTTLALLLGRRGF